jgi:hypothetical protein
VIQSQEVVGIDDGQCHDGKDIVIDVQLAANIAATDKEISGSIKPFQGYMLKDLDEQWEGHYQVATKVVRRTLWQKTY